MIGRPLLDNRAGKVFDLTEIATRKKNEQTLTEGVLVDLRYARAIRGAPKLIVAANQLIDQQRFIDPAVAIGERFKQNVSALEIVLKNLDAVGGAKPNRHQTATM
ncbi:UNVERIFIED_ORG: hypothetical protein M2442_002489 [Methylorubrum zatmanii]|nr:hypothetical protein [Methylorubrum zatmanii]